MPIQKLRPHSFPLMHERVSGAVSQFAKTCPLTADVKIEYRPFDAALPEKIQVRVANTEVKIAITEQLLFQNFSLANLSHLTHFQKAERPFWIGSNQGGNGGSQAPAGRQTPIAGRRRPTPGSFRQGARCRALIGWLHSRRTTFPKIIGTSSFAISTVASRCGWTSRRVPTRLSDSRPAP
ncbi:hypothetical protein MPL3365_70147 [Mesorhizobium plurifarium]|uniref:Uncharacterized protein n=1 Tax=Mesorhizobium plurifarium TaxID=69974 RepID=A0A090GGY5_MESPL|nr:hypothetical protein MPL3365_70147 [Mesorhizobium plurifarium]